MCILCGRSVGRKEGRGTIISFPLKPEELSPAGLHPCMGASWSITFHAQLTEGDGPSDMPLHKITLTSPLKYPKSLAPLWRRTKVRVHRQTKGWRKKVQVTIATPSRPAGFISKGPSFLPELQESEAIYLHCNTEGLKKSRRRGRRLSPVCAVWFIQFGDPIFVLAMYRTGSMLSQGLPVHWDWVKLNKFIV